LIYFLKNPETGLVKIGYSARHTTRIREITNSEGVQLVGIGVLAGDLSSEKELHRRFAHLRCHGEWFRYENDLEAFITENASPFRSLTEE